MRPTRKKKLDEVIRELLAEILLARANDPRLTLVTITSVQVSPELDVAKVFFSVLGDESKRDETVAALRRAAPFLRSELARELRVRRTPELRFHYDESMARGLRMESVLRDIADERASRIDDDSPGDPGNDAPRAPEGEDEDA